MSPERDPRSGLPLRVVVPARPTAVRVVDGSRVAYLTNRARAQRERYLAQGRAEGERLAIASAAGALQRAAQALEEAGKHASDQVARDSIALGVEIARTLLRHEIDQGRYDLERIVRETLAASNAGRGACVVHLNPADVARLEGVAFRSGTTVEADSEVPPGDVHVTTQRGLLVRDVEQAVSAIAERLEGEVA